jgi:hypothetical protein
MPTDAAMKRGRFSEWIVRPIGQTIRTGNQPDQNRTAPAMLYEPLLAGVILLFVYK